MLRTRSRIETFRLNTQSGPNKARAKEVSAFSERYIQRRVLLAIFRFIKENGPTNYKGQAIEPQ